MPPTFVALQTTKLLEGKKRGLQRTWIQGITDHQGQFEVMLHIERLNGKSNPKILLFYGNKTPLCYNFSRIVMGAEKSENLVLSKQDMNYTS